MAACPRCKSKIRFHTVLFALCPIWITCPSCKTRLTGNILLEVQAFVIIILGLVGGGALVSAWQKFHFSLPAGALIMFGSVFSIVLPNVYITLKYGKFFERG